MRTRKLEAYHGQIAQAYAGGVSMALLAQTHGVSIGTIRNILLRLNVPIRKPGRPNVV